MTEDNVWATPVRNRIPYEGSSEIQRLVIATKLLNHCMGNTVKMKSKHMTTFIFGTLAALGSAALAYSASGARLVTVENYNRAQSDFNFAGVVNSGGFGKFHHGRELAPVVQQGIVRPNRDTLYSFAILDLEAAPATITLPDAGKRYMGMQVVNEDQYTTATYYDAGAHSVTREMAGTRYVIVVVRFVVDFSSPDDIRKVHALQDAITLTQQRPGIFAIPDWDQVSLRKVQTALQQLGTTISDTRGMFGANTTEVDPVKHLIGTAMLWGGNPPKDGLYLPITPPLNDGKTLYSLTVGDVPVDGFWSVTVYNSDGYLQPNPNNAFSVNSLTAQRDSSRAIRIQFGGCAGHTPNCLPIVPGWNYTVRLFRPRPEILNGTWKFPLATPAG